MIKVYYQRKGKENASEQTVRTVFPEMIYGGELYRDDCNKVSFILNSYQDHLDSIKEFPDLTVEKRSAISIARRLQDPLSELGVALEKLLYLVI